MNIVNKIFFMSLLLVTGCEDRTYEKQRLAMAEKTKEVLIRNSACSSIQDCQQKQLYFLSPINSGVSIQLYSNLEAETLSELLGIYSEEFFKLNGKMKLEITTYSISKKEELETFWNRSQPLYQIIFERKE